MCQSPHSALQLDFLHTSQRIGWSQFWKNEAAIIELSFVSCDNLFKLFKCPVDCLPICSLVLLIPWLALHIDGRAIVNALEESHFPPWIEFHDLICNVFSDVTMMR